MITLDKRQRRLLSLIDLGGRMTTAELARRTGYSKDYVATTIGALEQNGVIKGYNGIIDISQLGYTPYAVYSRLENPGEKRRKNFLEYLRKIQAVYWIATLGGQFDILIAVQAKSAHDFYERLSQLHHRFHFVRDTQVAIRVTATQFPRKYLDPETRFSQLLTFKAGVGNNKLIEVEEHLITELCNDPRTPMVTLAKRLRISRPTLYSRLRDLESRGVIQGYTSFIDCASFGYSCYILGIKLRAFDTSIRKQMFEFARTNPNVTFYVETVGCWHAELHCEVAGQRELQDLLSKLHGEFGATIDNVEIIVCFDYYTKYGFTA